MTGTSRGRAEGGGEQLREEYSGNMTFEQKPEEGKSVSCADISRKNIVGQGTGTANTKDSRVSVLDMFTGQQGPRMLMWQGPSERTGRSRDETEKVAGP